MGRFKDGNDPGNGRDKQGKGNFVTTANGDHILGTTGNDNGSSDGATPIDVDGYTNLLDLKAGDDLFNGFAGDDWVYGNDGDDNLNGGEGDDVLVGGNDDDTIEGGAGGDHIDGSDGNDTASYADAPEDDPLVTDFGTFNGVAVSLLTDRAANSDAEGDELDSIENLVGSDFDDFLQGDNEANTIAGGDGDDVLRGENGDDTIDGGGGDDDISGGDGADTLSGGPGGDTDLFDLGLTSGADEDPANTLARDNFRDTVVAQADFASNGTDNIVHYSDGQDDENSGFAFDVIDFSALLGDGGDPNGVLFVVQNGTDTQIWEDATDDDIFNSTDDAQWFSISETPAVGGNPAESVFIQVGDDTYKWDALNEDWDMLV